MRLGIDKDLVATAKEVSSGKYFLLYTAPEAVVEDHCWRIHFLLYQRYYTFQNVAMDSDKWTNGRLRHRGLRACMVGGAHTTS